MSDFPELAVQMILNAIAEHPDLSGDFLLKGGRLMHQKYQSPRTTTDIDFSCTKKTLNQEITNDLKEKLNEALSDETIKPESFFSYSEVFSIKQNPAEFRKDGTPKIRTFPALKIKIKSSPKRSKREILTDLDCSFNEFTGQRDKVTLSKEGEPEQTISCYALEMLVAEKFRALLQQAKRHRERCQDVFDLHFLIIHRGKELHNQEKRIYEYLSRSIENKGIDDLFNKNALENEEIKARSQSGYAALRSEIPKALIPPFEEAYQIVNQFFQSLPWPLENDDWNIVSQ